MKTKTIFPAGTLLLILAMTASSTSVARDHIFTFQYDNVLGTSLEIKAVASTAAQAHKAEAAVLAEISREARILSTWDPESEVSRWTRTRGDAVPVSEELYQILGMYDQWRTRTNGALNPSAQSVIAVWQTAAKANRTPSASELAEAVAKARENQWILNPAARTATHTGSAPLVFASFTKSFIIDKAANAALRTGVQSVVVNIGGDIAVRGRLAEPVDIADPRSSQENADPISRIMVHNLAVATSGDYRRGIEIAGRHYSHIVDPRTGLPAENVISSTVVAPNPADAGALATAFSILSVQESEKLAASIPGVAYLLVGKNGRRIQSDNWETLEAPIGQIEMAAVTRPAYGRLSFAAAIPEGGAWDSSMELTIDFEIAQTRGMAKRPFVAAWVEDADHFQIRTIALWYHEDRYLTEMKSWFRSDRMRAMAEGKEIFRTISSATRGPGKYSLKWDGKDNVGKLARAGKYTVYLEIAREHGTHQLVKKEMEFNGTPDRIAFPANTELTSASFDYHKLAAK